MEASALADYVRDKLGDRVVAAEVTYDQVTVTVTPDSYPTAARLCKEDKALACDFFDFLCGVDERDTGFGVVTRLYSVAHRHGVTLRTIADGGREEPRVPTLTGVYRGADWHERETYDMFGIVFDGHPGLLPRLLTVENFEGWPLRKEFRLASRDVKPWPGAKEPGGEGEPEAAGGTPAASAQAAEDAAAPVDKAAAAKAKAERAKALAAEARRRKGAEQAAALSADAGDAGDVAIEDAAEAIAEAPTAAEAATVAAELDQSDDAMDAAAGAVTGDTAAGATSDERGVDEPRPEPAQEAAAHEGGAAEPGGTPGVEAEGSHDEAEDLPDQVEEPTAEDRDE